jgi:hypothetical protein
MHFRMKQPVDENCLLFIPIDFEPEIQDTETGVREAQSGKHQVARRDGPRRLNEPKNNH